MQTLQEWFDNLPASQRNPWTTATLYDEATRQGYTASKRTFYRLFEQPLDELTIKEVNLFHTLLGAKPMI